MITKANEITTIISWIVAASAFIYAQIRAAILKKKVNRLTEKLDENKKNQKEDENMAVFKCDSCGKEVEVCNAHSTPRINGKQYDFCPECGEKYNTLIHKQSIAESNLKLAQTEYEEASKELNAILKISPAPDKINEALSKLGIGGNNNA